MVDRAAYEPVLALLDALDANALREAGCWLGGGAGVALRCGGYRVSRDVDLLCADAAGYRALRGRVFDAGLRALFRRDVVVVRQARADRYGIRGAVAVGGAPIKIEVVREARVELEGVADPYLPVARLCDADMVAEKLLANDDRLNDDAALGRDALDLLMLERALGGLPEVAWDKAREAYGPSIDVAFARALDHLRANPADLERAFETFDVLPDARAYLNERIARSAP
ncbi:MAG TPA: nucleotidyl transferase AbiEii/AbiGii toxin family protein [Byssovorax sp.]